MNLPEPPVTAIVMGPLFLDIVMGPLDALPAPGQESWVTGCNFVPGGAANQAVALGKLGITAHLCSYIGTDDAGQLTQKLLEEHGVCLENLVPCDRQSVTASMSVGSDRAMVTYGTDKAPRLQAQESPRIVIGDAHALAENIEIIRKWRGQEDAPIVIADVGWDDSGRWNLEDLTTLEVADCFVPNEDEALLYTGCDNVNEAAHFLQKLVPTVVITQGSNGVFAYNGDEEVTLPGIPVRTVDPTGAGDTFGAGLAWGLARGLSLRQAVSTAAAAATFSVLGLGGSASAPTIDQLRDWVKNHPLPTGYDLSAL